MGSSRMNVRDFSEWDESDVRVRPNKKGSRPPHERTARPSKKRFRGRVITVDRGRWSVVVDEGTEKGAYPHCGARLRSCAAPRL